MFLLHLKENLSSLASNVGMKYISAELQAIRILSDKKCAKMCLIVFGDEPIPFYLQHVSLEN